MKWQVYLYGIMWDDGKGEYDVSELPDNLRVTVDHEDYTTSKDAIERALQDATDEFGSLIVGTEQIEVTQVS